jgi:hypothetical protein
MAKRKVPVILADGKPRHLFYNFNALVELTETLGIDIMNIQSVLNGTGMLKAVRGILWAGLVHEDKTLTLEGAGDLIEFRKIEELTKSILEALDAAFKSDGDPKNAEAPVIPATEASPSTVAASSEQVSEQLTH